MDSQTEKTFPDPKSSRRKKKISTVRKWPKRILKPFSLVLTTGDDTDTVDRLFVSKHVNDLRLITAAAFVVLTVVIILAAATAISTAIVDPAPTAFVSEAKRLVDSSTAAGGVFLKLFAPTFLVFSAILTWAYQVGSARLGVVDLFACEIDTLCRVITVVNMVNNQAAAYNVDPSKSAQDGKTMTMKPAHFSSQEEYFPILANNSRDLQTLEANVVINITAFYTFMKAVRDTFRQLSDAQNDEQLRQSMRNLIYMVYLGLESGRNALDDLVEFEPTHTERTMVILLSELDAYYFLRDVFRDPNEVHYERLILRGPTYTTLVHRLNNLLECKRKELMSEARGGEIQDRTYEVKQWMAAIQLRDSLNSRFNRLQAKFPLRCVAEGDRIMAGPTVQLATQPLTEWR